MKHFLICLFIALFFGLSCDGVSDNNNERSLLLLNSKKECPTCPECPVCPECKIGKILVTTNPCETDKTILRIFYSDTILYFGQTKDGNWIIMEVETEYEYNCTTVCKPCKIKITSDGVLKRSCYTYYGGWSTWTIVSW